MPEDQIHGGLFRQFLDGVEPDFEELDRVHISSVGNVLLRLLPCCIPGPFIGVHGSEEVDLYVQVHRSREVSGDVLILDNEFSQGAWVVEDEDGFGEETCEEVLTQARLPEGFALVEHARAIAADNILHKRDILTHDPLVPDCEAAAFAGWPGQAELQEYDAGELFGERLQVEDASRQRLLVLRFRFLRAVSMGHISNKARAAYVGVHDLDEQVVVVVVCLGVQSGVLRSSAGWRAR